MRQELQIYTRLKHQGLRIYEIAYRILLRQHREVAGNASVSLN
jgi:hypothetical protein